MRALGALALLTLLATTAGAAPAGSASIHGVWLLENGKIAVEIAPCGEQLCGKIAWLAPGLPTRDVDNRDPALRDRELLGLQVITGLAASEEDDTRFEGGVFYDPMQGRSYYRCRVQLQPDGSLKLRGYADVERNGRLVRSRFSRTVRWTRAELAELGG